MAVLASIGAWIVAFLTSQTAAAAAEFVAFRALWLFLIVTVLPYVLVKLGSTLSGYVYDYATSHLTTQFSPFTIEATGMFGWLLDCFQLPYIFTVLLTAYSIRFSIKFYKLLLVWK